MTEEYIYAGYACIQGGKKGWRLVHRECPDDEEKQIIAKGNTPSYVLGDVVEVEKEDGQFFHELKDERVEDEELLDRLRAESKMQYQKYQKELNRRKLDKDMKDIEDMTVRELKEYADKGYFNKSVIVQYLLERL